MKTQLILLATLFALNISALSAAEPTASQRPEKKKTTETNGPAIVDPETVNEDRVQKDQLRSDLLFRRLVPVSPREADFEEILPAASDANNRKGQTNAPAVPVSNPGGDPESKQPLSTAKLAPAPPAEAEFSEE